MEDTTHIGETPLQNVKDIWRHVAYQALHQLKIVGNHIHFGESNQVLFEFVELERLHQLDRKDLLDLL